MGEETESAGPHASSGHNPEEFPQWLLHSLHRNPAIKLARTEAGTAMRNILLTTATLMVLTGDIAHAASTNDETFANAALRELHKLAVASAQSERAAKDSDVLGCQDAYKSMQEAAHEALMNMHYISFAPIDAIGRVSSLLRVSQSAPEGCPNDVVTRTDTLPMLAGQAVMALRYDYSIGDGDWYTVNASGDVEAKNPLRYAQSLSRLLLGRRPVKGYVPHGRVRLEG
jgi:hypothetical protein